MTGEELANGLLIPAHSCVEIKIFDLE
jgi:hypothetical protein